MKQVVIFLLGISINMAAFGQSSFWDSSIRVDASFAVSSNQFLGNVALGKLHALKSEGKFKMGYGVRFNTLFSGSVEYRTAPAELTSGKTGLGVIFTENIEANLDTITLANANFLALNAFVTLQYDFTPKWSLAFAIDAIGFTLGAEKNGTFSSSEYPETNGVYQASPTTFNLLLTSDNDIGTLNSELMLSYRANEQWAFRAGPSFIFTEITTTTPAALNNDRFRNKALLFTLGASYFPFD
ncbi:hypothetical protein QWY31_01565 [Cytophagales bacterium LB-30]|uniref:Outer membrane protein beta-barrel domain-containing protein n=1 Tax=Shiella aurantiaca TaxID=3058365 RepID=A0ABT8F183_9BACT|nr:hypothetical protein [Shiella aurantiaca]MDN4164165.1 hypothetical protein [Shiella aurantiaca]